LENDGENDSPGDRVVYQVEESRSGSTYQAYCPELILLGFGDTPEEAKVALQREVGTYLEDCDRLGILEDVLIEAGFYDDGDRWVSNAVVPAHEPKILMLDSETGLLEGLRELIPEIPPDPPL
jgi:hypothetical protein